MGCIFIATISAFFRRDLSRQRLLHSGFLWDSSDCLLFFETEKSWNCGNYLEVDWVNQFSSHRCYWLAWICVCRGELWDTPLMTCSHLSAGQGWIWFNLGMFMHCLHKELSCERKSLCWVVFSVILISTVLLAVLCCLPLCYIIHNEKEINYHVESQT